ncbi:MAG: lysophospholipid acyltransferase family protein [Endomicrobiaceae bacterium]|jgi:1-acyl-sn-glycerol-3-phosphate acyltransferase|nr:lysophospholipid acyltransferase family protein [Endomicrobiaceae bacterium]MDD3729636.1 lysophospholipid acyltransferase family protein [Endomicrobiaceae bacterium]MDD4165870.1 lysophospholipid acyltransferase family protein [Endomicrobiaceae bacterium]
MQIRNGSSVLYYFGRFLFKLMFLFIFRCKSEGKENIPENTGVIISPNHMSFFDPPLTGCFMNQDLYFMAKQELFEIPVLGFLIKRTNAFPVKRGMQDMSAFRNAFSLLENKKALLMFPEGTRSKDGIIGKARAGVGMVACIAQVPVVPVKIVNTNNMKKFKQIIIKYGKPVYPPKEYTKEDYIKLSFKILEKIKEL